MLLTTPLPAAPTAQAPAQAPTLVAAPTPASSPERAATDPLLWALQQQARRSGEAVAAELAAYTPRDQQLSLIQVWDRMQQATDALYRSLGERRMGDYPPDLESVSRALTQIGAWHVIALHAAQRLHEPGEGA